MPETLFDKIEHFRPTVLVNVPTMINQMLTHPGSESRDLSSLRVATSAGEALPVELHRRWAEAGTRLSAPDGADVEVVELPFVQPEAGSLDNPS